MLFRAARYYLRSNWLKLAAAAVVLVVYSILIVNNARTTPMTYEAFAAQYDRYSYIRSEKAALDRLAEREKIPRELLGDSFEEAYPVETTAHVYSYLTTGDWLLPLRPADWGVAVFRLEDGREIDGFRAWEGKQWRTWSGPMNKDGWHYSIRSTRDELTGLFPALSEESPVWLDATLDMGDKQVSGRLEATLSGDFEEGGPALLFYPAETSGYQGADLLEPGYPTQLFLCAQPGNEGSCRGLYYMAEKGIYFETGPYRTAYAWELAHLLDSLRQFGALPEETFRPIHDVTVPEGTSYGTWLEPLYRAGILRPDDPDWAFDPEAPVSRAQWAVVLHRLLEPAVR